MGGVEIESRLGGDQEDVVRSDVHYRPLDRLLARIGSPAGAVLREGSLLTRLPLDFGVGAQKGPQILPTETQCWG